MDAGLADEVATFEETLAMITRKTAPDGARLGSAANPGPGEEGDEDMSATETKTQDRPNSGQPAPTAAAPTAGYRIHHVKVATRFLSRLGLCGV